MHLGSRKKTIESEAKKIILLGVNSRINHIPCFSDLRTETNPNQEK